MPCNSRAIPVQCRAVPCSLSLSLMQVGRVPCRARVALTTQGHKQIQRPQGSRASCSAVPCRAVPWLTAACRGLPWPAVAWLCRGLPWPAAMFARQMETDQHLRSILVQLQQGRLSLQDVMHDDARSTKRAPAQVSSVCCSRMKK